MQNSLPNHGEDRGGTDDEFGLGSKVDRSKYEGGAQHGQSLPYSDGTGYGFVPMVVARANKEAQLDVDQAPGHIYGVFPEGHFQQGWTVWQAAGERDAAIYWDYDNGPDDDEFEPDFREDIRADVQPSFPLRSQYTPPEKPMRVSQTIIDESNPDRPILKVSWPVETGEDEVGSIWKARRTASDIDTINHFLTIPTILDHSHPTRASRHSLIIGDERRPRFASQIRRMILGVSPISTRNLQPDLFMKAWIQSYCCHFRLRKIGREHKDISAANLMWDPIEQVGVLNDFDLAITEDAKRPSGSERTGTIPFMAMDLLCEEYSEGKITRAYRHDLESFIWVLAWTALLDNEVIRNSFTNWNTSDLNLSLQGKEHILLISGRGKSRNYTGKQAGEKRWAFALAMLSFWGRLFLDGRPGERLEDLTSEVLFEKFDTQVNSEWKWADNGIPFEPML